MTYDRDLRCDTPLARKLKARISAHGPMAIEDYIAACNWDEEFGYYATRACIGAGGDFVTAPEISQVFGEIVGAWCVVVWQQMGAPPSFEIVEAGPGRGTLMADAARVLVGVPGLSDAVRIRLVEPSQVLRDVQKQTLQNSPLEFIWTADDFGDGDRPVIYLGNEFLDTGPLTQWVKIRDGWRLRGVGLDKDGELTFDIVPNTRIADHLDTLWPQAKIGDVAESLRPDLWVQLFKDAAQRQPMAALLIDYGHTESRLGDTFQAVRGHKYEHPLTSPGEADLSAQVDFQKVKDDAIKIGLTVDGPIIQTEFLGILGAVERASRLMGQNPERAAEIEAGVARLMAPIGMGTRFKVIGLRSGIDGPLPGFGELDSPAPAP